LTEPASPLASGITEAYGEKNRQDFQDEQDEDLEFVENLLAMPALTLLRPIVTERNGGFRSATQSDGPEGPSYGKQLNPK